MAENALGATHLIEGSVRKVGDRVRITAQLRRFSSLRNHLLNLTSQLSNSGLSAILIVGVQDGVL